VPGGLGLRFALEATLLVTVAIVAVVANFHWPAIILVMALAWVLVSAVEWGISRRSATSRAESAAAEAERPADVEIPQHVRVLVADAPPAQKPKPKPARVPARPTPKPAPAPELEPEPEPVRPALTSAPEPPPPLEPVPAAAPPAVVPLVSRDARPREWNLWELERLTRAGGGHDPAVDEERNYLLMYLREFASADGALPMDFDGLVRDSFGDLIGVA
jgi:hypothetical protein